MKKNIFAFLTILILAVSVFSTEITVSSFSNAQWKYGGRTATLRAYLSDQIVTSDKKVLSRSQKIASTGWYKEISCSVTDTTVKCPSFAIDSTTDSSVPTATITFVWWDQAGAKRETLGVFRIPPTPNPTNFPVLTVYNSAPARSGNSPAVGDSIGNYASLAAAIKAAGEIPTVFLMPGTLNISNAQVIPKNVYLVPARGAKFVKNGSGTIEFQGQGIVGAGRLDLFSSFEAGEIQWSGALPEEFYPEWFGAVGDAATDDLRAFDNLIAAVKYEHTLSGLITVAPVSLAAGKKYYLSGTLHIDIPVDMYGEGANNGSELRFPVNTAGIVLHSYNSKTGANNQKRSDYSKLRNFRVVGNNGLAPASSITNTHTVNVSGLTLAKTVGPNFTMVGGYLSGTTLTINGFPYVLETVDSTSQITLRKPKVKFYGTTPGQNQLLLTGDYAARVPTDGAWDGQTITIDGNNYTIGSTDVSGRYQRINLRGKITTASNHGEIQNIGSILGAGMRPSIYHGIDVRSHSELEGMYVLYFPGDGIRSASSASPGNPNSNLSRFDRNTLNSNSGSGIFLQGNDANQINLINNDCSYNGGWGIWEHSFLGNTFFGNHTASNWSGSRDGEAGGVNASTWVGEYAEADQQPEEFGGQHLIFGGVSGPGYTDANSGVVFQASLGRLLSRNFAFTKPSGPTGAKSVTFSNYSNLVNHILGFGAGEEAANTVAGYPAGNAVFPAYKLRYNDPGVNIPAGWYGLEFKTDASGSGGRLPFLLSGSNASETGGQIWFREGFYAGILSTTRRRFDFVSAIPTSGTVSRGDIFWNNGAGVGTTAPLGWVATTAGTIGSGAVLMPFYANPPMAAGPGTVGGTNPWIFSATAVLDFGSTNAGTSADLTISMPGAAPGDSVSLGIPNGSVNPDSNYSAWVSAANIVSVRFNNYSRGAINPARGTFRVTIMQF